MNYIESTTPVFSVFKNAVCKRIEDKQTEQENDDAFYNVLDTSRAFIFLWFALTRFCAEPPLCGRSMLVQR